MSQVIQFDLKVLETTTRTPVVGALVNINRASKGVTGASGELSVRVLFPSYATTALVEASKEGYTSTPDMPGIDLGVSPISVVLYIRSLTGIVEKTVQVKDQTTGNKIAGATIFLNTDPPVTTDASGKAAVSCRPGQNLLSIRASGYISQVIPFSGTAVPDTIALASSSVPRLITIQVLAGDSTPVVSTAYVSITNNGASVTTGYTDSGGNLISSSNLADGIYGITIQADGWNTLTDVLQVQAGTSTYSFILSRNAAGAVDQTGSQAPAAGADQVAMVKADPGDIEPGINVGLLQPPVQVEWIPPNGDFGKYFTTTQARIYIGNLFVDELNTVQFTLQANRVPIYGYASRDFDDVGTGKCLVQGQLAINFVSEGYLYTVLKEYDRFYRKTLADTDAKAAQKKEFENLRLTRASLLTSASMTTARPFTFGGPQDNEDLNTRVQAIDLRMQQLAASGPDVVAHSSRVQFINSSKLDPTAARFTNAAYLPVAFDVQVELQGAGRTVKRLLERCYLTGNDQIMDQSGEGLLDVYSFIARRLR